MGNTTIHIFKYGEAQIISDGVNFKAKTSDFSKLQAVITNIKSKRPSDVEDKEFHVVHVFVDSKVNYNSVEKGGSFSIKYSALDKSKIDALVAEFKALKKVADNVIPITVG